MIDSALIGGAATGLVKAWRSGTKKTRIAISLAGIALSFSALVQIGADSELFFRPVANLISAALALPAILVLFFAGASVAEERITEQRNEIKEAEQRLRSDPDKATNAWEVARLNLQSYIDRNLSQVSWIFGLIALVMMGGFILVVVGVVEVWSDPARLPSSIVAAGSGIVIQFISATFLFVYKSTNEQARDYVEMLERINAVGMSAQLLEGLAEERFELRDTARVELANGLLSMYTPPRGSMSNRSKKAKATT